MQQTRPAFEDIRSCLQAFRAQEIRLADLVERVPTLVKQLDVDDGWRAAFVGYWWTLEQVHEEAIEAGESRRLPEQRRVAVDEAIGGMLALLDQVAPVDLTE